MQKEQILEILRRIKFSKSNLLEENLVKDVQIEDLKVKIILAISNPAFHVKKKLETEILKAIHEKFPKTKIFIEFLMESKEKIQIRGNEIPGVKNIIAVASGKGGVGKSTLAANIAICLSQMGFDTGLLDADIYGPSSTILFDVENARPKSKWVDEKNKMEPIENYGIKILSMGFFAKESQAIVWRGPMASKALKQLIREAHWGELDFLILDLPPGTGDIHLSLVQEIPITGALIIGTPQKIATADLKKAIAMFNLESINVPILGIIENMAYFTPEELPEHKYFIFGKEGTKKLASDLGFPFLGQIPLIQSIQEASDVGRPAALQSNSMTSEYFKSITKKMIEQLVKRNKDLPPTEVVRITTMAGCSSFI